jgi:hypothetical protein
MPGKKNSMRGADQRQPNRNAVNRKYQFARQLNGSVENRCNHRAGISKPSRNDSAIGESLDLLEGLFQTLSNLNSWCICIKGSDVTRAGAP